MGLISKIFGDFNSKQIARIEKITDIIESYDAAMQQLSDEELKAKTQYFKEQLAAGKTLDDILPEAFAVCREAGSRVLGMKHFRVQLMGGIVLHEGNISEMKTGEGKTLVATLPAYLNALEGKGVHVVTVNDYLAQRDKEWMGQIYEFLGLTVGCIIHGITSEERKAAYEADITYGTNNEFGFDYLRDNMAVYKEEQMQRPLNYAIVDEVDSILIDEARTPLIISGMGSDATDLYKTADRFVKGLHGRIISQEEKEKTPFNMDNGLDIEELNKGFDYTVDEKERSVSLTAEGLAKAEKFFGIENFADPENMEINHHVQIALKAHYIMKADVDYIEKDGEIIIVDEFTGRLMFGRRFSDGLHQAIEAKEGITVRKESKTLATITIQNYFRMYKKLAGMTGTAKTEEDEFREIYNMETVVVPSNKPVVRDDMEDAVYSTTKAKFSAIVEEIVERHSTGQPVLVGTISVEKSEILSLMLKKRGVKHDVLNAKQHMREAEIIAQAGRLNAVTIATNMAGRGTDIILGGGDPEEREKVIALGGLHVLGTERHESRRIDNQLRGRAGRQGDPGSSQFFVSLEDDLMRLFGGDKVKFIFEKTNMADERIEAGLLSKTIEGAQKKIESRNYASRKYVLQYDDVMNKQREIIYGERNRVLHGEDLGEHICSMMKDLANEQSEFVSALTKDAREWDFTDLKTKLRSFSPRINCPSYSEDELAHLTKEKLAEDITAAFTDAYKKKKESIGPIFSEIERMILLRIVDAKWMDHIDLMDQLKKGMGLRAYGQQDPAVAYANEGLEMFEDMIKSICEEMVKYCFAVTLQTTADRKQRVSGGTDIKQEAESLLNSRRGNSAPKAAPKATSDNGGEKAMPVHVEKTPGRNDPCPCGSGKKYKNCCGKQTE